MDRAQQRQAFLANSSFAGASLEALPVDASFRSYFRVHGGQRPALLMDAPPPVEDVRPFVRIANHLLKLGLSAPQIFGCDEEQGFLTLEDFGDETYTRLLAAGGSEQALYELAIDTLASLHGQPEASKVEAPVYSADILLAESQVFTEWFFPWLMGSSADETALQAYLAAWDGVLSNLPAPAESLVLRDFHVDNLMRLERRAGVAACGLLDFQDALIGPTAYDVVSLLEDARRDLAPGLAEQMLARYCTHRQLQGESKDNFMRWYHVLGAQRHCRVLGVFVRLFKRDGKDIYLKHLPRLAGLLQSHLDQAELLPLKSWVDEYLGEALGRFAAGG